MLWNRIDDDKKLHNHMNESKLICVAPNLFYGNLEAGHNAPDESATTDAAIVHACKDPCHKKSVGYEKKIETDHPNYLSHEVDTNLYLNMVDPPVPLFKLETFAIFFDFVDRMIISRPVIIHCNQGLSRSPSLTLVYMAKRLKLLPDTDYVAARAAFESLDYPYQPGKGIETFLTKEWSNIGLQKSESKLN